MCLLGTLRSPKSGTLLSNVSPLSPPFPSLTPRPPLSSSSPRVTLVEDNSRKILLYTPAVALTTLVWTEVIYEFLNIFNAHLNPLLLLVLGLFPIYKGGKYITEEIMFTGDMKVRRKERGGEEERR